MKTTNYAHLALALDCIEAATAQHGTATAKADSKSRIISVSAANKHSPAPRRVYTTRIHPLATFFVFFFLSFPSSDWGVRRSGVGQWGIARGHSGTQGQIGFGRRLHGAGVFVVFVVYID